MSQYFKGLILFCCSIALFTACVKDKPNPGNNGNPATEDRKILIANEGVFGNGNASLSYINTVTDSIINNVYTAANNVPLGDVLQSLSVWNGKLYLVVNNSNKIVIVDKKTFVKQGEISVNQPRYIQFVDQHKAYITSMYGRRIFVLNPTTNQITDTIATTNKNNEGITLLNNKVYVCPWDTGSNFIHEIDPSANVISRQINIGGYAPTQVLVDKNQKLWVLAGNHTYNKPSTLTQLDPVSGSIIKTISFGSDADLIKPAFNATRDTIYFIGVNYQGTANAYNGIYRIPITATQAPTQAFIAAQQLQYFWALGIDPVTGLIYVGDPKGFIQKGSVLVYRPDGTPVKQFLAELGPGYFYFE